MYGNRNYGLTASDLENTSRASGFFGNLANTVGVGTKTKEDVGDSKAKELYKQAGILLPLDLSNKYVKTQTIPKSLLKYDQTVLSNLDKISKLKEVMAQKLVDASHLYFEIIREEKLRRKDPSYEREESQNVIQYRMLEKEINDLMNDVQDMMTIVSKRPSAAANAAPMRQSPRSLPSLPRSTSGNSSVSMVRIPMMQSMMPSSPLRRSGIVSMCSPKRRRRRGRSGRRR